ncbi:hypothetical protein NHH82_04795 [Oxalobacteraceae bacterium OTU3REALA1]|nr:hypothetical protein NHH82_04795 [Oxalobacteraceae bacterium OTU3REALA1]
MAPLIFRRTIFLTILVLCGCSSPHVTPHYYVPQTAGHDGTAVTPTERRLSVAPPDSLEEAMVSVENLQRQYAWQSSAIDGTSNNLGTFLIGLASFGAYKGLTHPGTGTMAATGALGAGAYAYGTGNKLGPRGNAYSDGYERLACSLIAAAPYKLRMPPASEMGVGNIARRLGTKLSAAESARATIDSLAAELAYHRTPQVIQQAKSATSTCPALGGQHWRAAYDKACKVAATKGKMRQPPPRLLAALSRAGSLSSRLGASLKLAHGLDNTSRQMGEHLWQNAKFIDSQVGRAVRGTIADPLDAIDRVKTYMTRKDGAPADPRSGKETQSGNDDPEPYDGTLEWDAAAQNALLDLEAANRTAQINLIELDGILSANPIPPKPDFSQIDSCRSPADQVAQGIVAASAVPTPAPAAKEDTKVTTNRSVIDMLAEPAFLSALDLSGKPDEAALRSHIKTCQKERNQQATGEVSPELYKTIKDGHCKGLKWT